MSNGKLFGDIVVKETNEGGYSPEVFQAIILLHGIVDVVGLKIALGNKTPFYKSITLDTASNMRVENRLIAFSLQKLMTGMNARKGLGTGVNGDVSIPIMTDMSGLGIKNNRDDLYLIIRPMGITWNLANKNEDYKLNIIAAGHLSVPNNGNKRINLGDTIIGDFPDNKDDGKPKNLIYTSYNSDIHKFNSHNIKKCVQSKKYGGDTRYMFNYKDACRNICKLIIQSFLLPSFLQRLSSDSHEKVTYDALLKNIDEIADDFKGQESGLQKASDKIMNDPTMEQTLLDLYFPDEMTDDDEIKKNGIEKFRFEYVDNMLRILTVFQNMVDRFKIGVATCSADPGKDFTINVNMVKQ